MADITYIRLRREFVYLAVLLDAYSRRCIGWSLGNTLQAELTLEALRMAFAQRDVGSALVHHSDRGVQYAAGDYTALLAEHGIAISMSRKASPNDDRFPDALENSSRDSLRPLLVQQPLLLLVRRPVVQLRVQPFFVVDALDELLDALLRLDVILVIVDWFPGW